MCLYRHFNGFEVSVRNCQCFDVVCGFREARGEESRGAGVKVFHRDAEQTLHGINSSATAAVSVTVCCGLILPYLILSYLTAKACFRLALKPPVGQMHVPELTFRLLEPLGVFSRLQERAPMLLYVVASNTNTQSVPMQLWQNILSLHFNGHFSRWTWVSRYQNVSILDLVGARVMEVVVTTGAIIRENLQSN